MHRFHKKTALKFTLQCQMPNSNPKHLARRQNRLNRQLQSTLGKRNEQIRRTWSHTKRLSDWSSTLKSSQQWRRLRHTSRVSHSQKRNRTLRWKGQLCRSLTSLSSLENRRIEKLVWLLLLTIHWSLKSCQTTAQHQRGSNLPRIRSLVLNFPFMSNQRPSFPRKVTLSKLAMGSPRTTSWRELKSKTKTPKLL